MSTENLWRTVILSLLGLALLAGFLEFFSCKYDFIKDGDKIYRMNRRNGQVQSCKVWPSGYDWWRDVSQ